jgi:hypothetical protein
MDIPMLDDLEFREVIEAGWQALEAYRRITGFEETNINAVWHHSLSLYGPPCHKCGKPLRTPRALWCPACGATPEVT